MWDLPQPGIKSVSPALAGGFLATGLPGKPHISLFRACSKNAVSKLLCILSTACNWVLVNRMILIKMAEPGKLSPYFSVRNRKTSFIPFPRQHSKVFEPLYILRSISAVTSLSSLVLILCVVSQRVRDHSFKALFLLCWNTGSSVSTWMAESVLLNEGGYCAHRFRLCVHYCTHHSLLRDGYRG